MCKSLAYKHFSQNETVQNKVQRIQNVLKKKIKLLKTKNVFREMIKMLNLLCSVLGMRSVHSGCCHPM